MSRIIAGSLRGKRIIAPTNFDVRPTTDFAKEAFFSIMEHQYDFEDISVLDLFGGIGSISYEFVSRGCNDVTTVEINNNHVKFIVETIIKLGIDKNINVIRKDVFSFLKQNKKKYNLIFADPPFDFSDKNYETIISTIINGDYLIDEGQFVLEHISKLDFSKNPNYLDSRKYGNIKFSFFKK